MARRWRYRVRPRKHKSDICAQSWSLRRRRRAVTPCPQPPMVRDCGFILVQIARQIAVPTNDNQVRAKLREHGEAICLFGETVSWLTKPSALDRIPRHVTRSVAAGRRWSTDTPLRTRQPGRLVSILTPPRVPFCQIPDRRERLRELLSRLVSAGESINKAEEEDEEMEDEVPVAVADSAPCRTFGVQQCCAARAGQGAFLH